MKQLNLCRCCLAVGCDKDISAEYEQDGRKEVYSDIILDTFNIFITYEDVGGKCQICETCIARLHDAAEFKKQVIEAGKTIAQSLRTQIKVEDYQIVVKDEEQVYEEVQLGEAIDFEEFNIDFQGNVDDAIYIINLEGRADDDQQLTAVAETILASQLEGRKRRRRGGRCGPKKLKKPKSEPKTQPEVTQSHLHKRANSLKLIRNSNMCLFKAGRAKFGCYYCYEQYQTMAELKEHAKIHSHTKELVIKINPVTGLAYKKAEISSLHCSRCLEPCEDIEALQEHLTIIHDFQFADAGHLLIPFKLDRGLQCAICDRVCNTFTFLNMHMNSHFPNYVCEICGAAYINFKNLDIHKRIVHTKKCKCPDKEKCTCNDEVKIGFKPNKRTCVECNTVFRYTYLLKEHNYQVHGAKRPIATCNICLKTFLTPNNLNLHVRRIHNAERNHICKICSMSFFTAHGMKKHIKRTHTNANVNYHCNYCACKFKMKYSLCKHIKNRHGRRLDGTVYEEVAIRLADLEGSMSPSPSVDRRRGAPEAGGKAGG